MDEQTKVNTDDIRNLVAEGVIENVQDSDEQTDNLEQDME